MPAVPPPHRTRRRWHVVVGLVGPSDVAALQSKVRTYHEQLLVAVANLQQAGTPLPSTGNFTQTTWDDLGTRIGLFLARDTFAPEVNPMAWLDAGSAYDEGRAIVGELDKWRDQLAAMKAPGTPEPMPVPSSDLSWAGSIGTVALLVLAFFALRELKS